MKRTLQRISLICALLLLITAIPIANAAEEPVTLRFSWWGSAPRNDATLAVIEQYKLIAPHVTIEGEYMGADGYPEKMKAQLMAGTAPDIIQSTEQWTGDLKPMGNFFIDLREYGDVLDISGFDPKFLEDTCTVDGVLNYLPTGVNNLTFIFNTQIMDKAGIAADQDWNWDTVITEGRKVNRLTGDEYFLCLGQTALQEVLRVYIRQLSGNQFINDDYTLGFTREQAVAMLEYEKLMFDEMILQPAEVSFSFNLQTVMSDPDWVNGKFAGTIDLTSVLGGIVEPFADSVDVARLPILPGATESGITIRASQIIGISNKSQYPEECAKFLDFFFNNREAIVTLKDTRSIQPTVNARQYCVEDDVVNPSVAKGVELGTNTPIPYTAENAPSRNAQVIVAFVNAVEKVGYGTATPERAADEMIAELTVIMEQLKADNM